MISKVERIDSSISEKTKALETSHGQLYLQHLHANTYCHLQRYFATPQ